MYNQLKQYSLVSCKNRLTYHQSSSQKFGLVAPIMRQFDVYDNNLRKLWPLSHIKHKSNIYP